METITIHKAKTQLSRLIEKACRAKKSLLLAGKSLWLSLYRLLRYKGDRKPGAWKGKIKIGPEFFEPLPPEELEGWE